MKQSKDDKHWSLRVRLRAEDDLTVEAGNLTFILSEDFGDDGVLALGRQGKQANKY